MATLPESVCALGWRETCESQTATYELKVRASWHEKSGLLAWGHRKDVGWSKLKAHD